MVKLVISQAIKLMQAIVIHAVLESSMRFLKVLASWVSVAGQLCASRRVYDVRVFSGGRVVQAVDMQAAFPNA